MKTVSCSDPNETFKELLLRIQSDFPKVKDCKVVLDAEEKTEYVPGSKLRDVLVSEATVVLSID